MRKKNTKVYQNLVKMGLTYDEARVFELLVKSGSLTARQLAKELSILPNAVYRLAKVLAAKGLLVRLSTSPIKFQVVNPEKSLKEYANRRANSLEQTATYVINALISQKTMGPETRVDIVTGQVEIFEAYVELEKVAKKEILVISIGEPVPDEVKLATKDALDRGVEIKFIFHLYTKENRDLLKSWVKMGAKVRHSPGWGYHFTIIDGKVSMVVANNPKETHERTGMVIYSKALTEAHRDYFFKLWKKAKPIL
jgi:sugar-specific transcriptional regulator TrmB